ncbi:recombinase family protein [Sphingomonas sp. AOB5]|uniref:recombinase family protein n=1 Tax=Sphingomonas sp. AOB5 TaxID=3034017 RepID=UPI0023F6416B|nr:recombinase family protein [Sphingomonas sp. AOB5]MDF7773632.1 recombinase family protein [Sphingomonas sp. AOB5]
MRDPRDVTGRTFRCAIYTRKSTEEGLEQDFNSLDAQREACAAYILSQRHEGWVQAPGIYEDGGFSGGNMERPGLKRLLAEVEAGKVDVIVVYKVDRLTRSLADFAKIVEVLDAKQASFVSVTQAFNTTTSMGRLTLNVLLSFAQFEREVTSERIRDKIAASKAKGMWMGGNPPLGYDIVDRRLVVNEVEAETVRLIFRRYVELASGTALLIELDAHGVTSKRWTGSNGIMRGGKPIGRGALYQMLQNRIYVGEIAHKGRVYPGQHDGIVDADIFAAAVDQLAKGKVERVLGHGAPDPSLLAGLLWDGHGRRMSPSNTNRGGRRYRYYASQVRDAEPKWRVSAADIEKRILASVANELTAAERAVLESGAPAAVDIERMQAVVRAAADRLANGTPRDQRQLIVDCVERIELATDAMTVRCKFGSVDDLLGDAPVDIILPIACVRSGKQLRLVIPTVETGTATRKNPALIKLVAQAMAAREVLATSGAAEFEELAAEIGYGREHAADLLRIGYLAPDIVSAIVEGRQPEGLTRTQLMRWASLPLEWAGQRVEMGF